MNFLSHRFLRLLISFLAFVLAIGLSFGFGSIVHSADEATAEPPTTTEITSLDPEGGAETGKGWVVTSKSGKSEMSLLMSQ
jgi:hypothetical protein